MRRLYKGVRLAAGIPSFVARSSASAFGIKSPSGIYYIVPGKNWSTDWDSHYITQAVRSRYNIPIQSSDLPYLLTGHVLHYGQTGEFLISLGSRQNHRNQLIATIFHGDIVNVPDNVIRNTETFVKHAHLLEKVVTACTIMEKRLIGWGVPANKVVAIPLGVDIEHFKPVIHTEKIRLRQQFSIPADAFCIGSFQKDGVGWGTGLEPKLIKGPDLFLEAMQALKPNIKNLFVVLTGPSRGYVKEGLDKLHIPFVHHMLDHYPDIVSFYQMLDCYLVASREEGGPKAILESMATGIPIVSSRVGMASDLIDSGHNGYLVEVEDVEAMVQRIQTIHQNQPLAQTLITNGLDTAAKHTWHAIGKRYYTEVYAPLLSKD